LAVLWVDLKAMSWVAETVLSWAAGLGALKAAMRDGWQVVNWDAARVACLAVLLVVLLATSKAGMRAEQMAGSWAVYLADLMASWSAESMVDEMVAYWVVH